MAAYEIALERVDSLAAGWHQSLLLRRVLRYEHRLRHSGLRLLLGRVRVVRALSPGGAPTWLGPSGGDWLSVCPGAGCQRDRSVAARCPGFVRVGMASAREREVCGIVALDTAGGSIRADWRLCGYCLYRWKALRPGFVVGSGAISAALLGGRLLPVAVALSVSTHLQASDNLLLAGSRVVNGDARSEEHTSELQSLRHL